MSDENIFLKKEFIMDLRSFLKEIINEINKETLNSTLSEEVANYLEKYEGIKLPWIKYKNENIEISEDKI